MATAQPAQLDRSVLRPFDILRLTQKYAGNEPFPNIVIDNLLNTGLTTFICEALELFNSKYCLSLFTDASGMNAPGSSLTTGDKVHRT